MTIAATDNATVVRTFLADMAGSRIDAALAALSDDVEYTNVGLATLRGRRRAGWVLNQLRRPYSGFDVQLTSIATEGDTVLTERVDELRVGPLRIRFWVVGRFDVHDSHITLWRDYFDNLDVLKGVLRGLLALVVPSAQRQLESIER